MSSQSSRSALAPAYRKALKTWRPVILYFGNDHCPACGWAGPVFREIAERYKDQANVYMLNTEQSPRHPKVTGTPTVLFYKDGKLLKKLKGIGTEQSLEEDFARHIGKLKRKPAPRKTHHDLRWLRHRFKTLCTLPRARYLLSHRPHGTC